MGIEVNLTGDDAMRFIMEQNEEQIETLKGHLRIAVDTIDRLSAKEEVSRKVVEDSKKATELKPSFIKPNVPKVEKSKITRTTWTEEEVAMIMWTMTRPEDEQNRLFTNLCEKLGRSKGSVSAKLKDLDLRVKNGIIYWRD